MKENSNNSLDSTQQDNEEDEDLIKINEMLIQVNKKKEEGNKLVYNKKYKEAEKIYLDALDIMNKFETKKKFKMDNEQKREKGKEIMLTMKNLYSNLSLCQGKQLKLKEAIQTSTYILSNLDAYHDKSYIRMMMWMIEINELDAAEEMKKDIESKFYGEQLKVFNTAFNLLKIKKEEAEEKIKNKIKNLEGKNIDIKEILNKENEINENKNEDISFIYNLFNKYKYFTFGIGGLIGGIGIFLLYRRGSHADESMLGLWRGRQRCRSSESETIRWPIR